MVAKDTKMVTAMELMNPYEKPPSMSVSQSMKTFLYNRETGAFMGRTASSWGKIGLFYLIFYGVLAALVAICFWGFFQTLDPRIPRWQLERSIIGTNPGLGFRPMPPTENVESTLIWYKGTDNENFKHWVDSLQNFLKDYITPGSVLGLGANINKCDYNQPPPPGKVCDVDVKNWYPCTKENRYNYHKSAPCIFLKLNKIYGWRPDFYNDTEHLPEKMPLDLKEHIASLKGNNSLQLNTIWVSCEGENPADQENIGPINYLPRRGFPGYFYPYENSEGYLSPLVAVHFVRPRTGILINVECKAWAKNIKHSRNDKIGAVHFELMID
ncbi:Sodium/potassium-transporting ATPase subunit beta-2 [Trachymyrmex septentrionalis]|uniref:Sodium/potassium-transporting ATPase subunit beta-2 n=2 Tax=Attini TaxID=143999 RepID=A0A151JW23_9HYME|nr:PREDICTED: sodium/potassium-transporting ATPase subunit beta-2-like [Trachymyrmex septentrionalis]KYN37501.1 Sodium/potassium-transporting ATPase subunit beta-2 [Trachymyrmex septentrionalis]